MLILTSGSVARSSCSISFCKKKHQQFNAFSYVKFTISNLLSNPKILQYYPNEHLQQFDSIFHTFSTFAEAFFASFLLLPHPSAKYFPCRSSMNEKKGKIRAEASTAQGELEMNLKPVANPCKCLSMRWSSFMHLKGIR